MIYCKIENGLVVDRALFDGSIPDAWPDRDAWIASDEAQIGWQYSGGQFVAPQQPVVPATTAEVKAECRRRILAIMTEDQQRNTLAAGQAATMQFGADPTRWPAELQARQAAAMAAWAEIERLRARSNEVELMDPIPADVTADELWEAP